MAYTDPTRPHPGGDGSTEAAASETTEAELARLRAENQRLRNEAHQAWQILDMVKDEALFIAAPDPGQPGSQDSGGEIVYMNRRGRELMTRFRDEVAERYGFDTLDLPGTSIHAFDTNPDRVRRRLASLRPGQESRNAYIHIGPYTVESFTQALTNPDGSIGGYVAIWKDATEQLNLEHTVGALKGLVNFARQVVNEVDPEEVTDMLARTLARNFDLDRIVVSTIEDDQVRLSAAYARDGEALTGYDPDFDTGNCKALRANHEFRVDDVSRDHCCPYQSFHQEAGSYLCLPLVTGGTNLGFIHMASPQVAYFTDETLEMISGYVEVTAPVINNIRMVAENKAMSLTDPLTGLHNRRFLEETMPLLEEQARRRDSPISLILADLDDFKSLNDRLGHKTGDQALQATADLLRRNTRNSDLCARWGGEEFVVLLPETDREEAA
ncbi:MAG: diguanylate cyclase, partial [Thiohalorhabdaceae bacterium]